MNNQIKQIFVNLPVKDVARTRDFWTKLGFAFNPQFTDDKALCLILKTDSIYAMLIAEDYFKTFTNRPIADGRTSQVLLAIDVGSRERVAEMMTIALANGATRYLEPEDMGWMYADRFSDPDGHQWEIMWADMSLLPKG